MIPNRKLNNPPKIQQDNDTPLSINPAYKHGSIVYLCTECRCQTVNPESKSDIVCECPK